MRIGYIYLYGEEWKEWQKNNPPLAELIEELKELGCEKIYMDVFIEDYDLKEIERMDMYQLFNMISDSPNDDQLVIRGRTSGNSTDKDINDRFEKELKRLHYRHHRQI